MAQTQDGRKRVWVGPYRKSDGTRVAPHYRTPPCPTPKQPRKGR